MTKQDFKAHKIQELRNEMYIAIKIYNKYMTDSYLNNLSTKAVIGQTSPLYREKWQDKFDKLNETSHE
jgi:hypothetical protein